MANRRIHLRGDWTQIRMAAATGVFTLVGGAVVRKLKRVAAGGSYALTGGAAGLSKGVSGGGGLTLTGATLSNLGAFNAGAVIGQLTLSGPQATPFVLSGAGSQYFTTDNGGMAPCNLIAAQNVPDGDYSTVQISWT